MRKLQIAILSILMAGCAHTRLKSWQGNQYTVCGNGWANQEDLEKEVTQHCKGGFKAIGGGESDTGTMYVSEGSVVSGKEQCVVYQCQQ